MRTYRVRYYLSGVDQSGEPWRHGYYMNGIEASTAAVAMARCEAKVKHIWPSVTVEAVRAVWTNRAEI